MSEAEQALAELMKVADEFDAIEAQFHEAQKRLIEHIRKAHEAGNPQAHIAQVIHRSRQRVGQYLKT